MDKVVEVMGNIQAMAFQVAEERQAIEKKIAEHQRKTNVSTILYSESYDRGVLDGRLEMLNEMLARFSAALHWK